MSEKGKKTATANILIVVGLIAAVAFAIVAKNSGKPTGEASLQSGAGTVESSPNTTAEAPTAKMPKMLDLGATKCVPCKMMEPILKELQRDYSGKFLIQFVDVWENPNASKEYGIRVIPTQIFYDVEGKEQFRHEGFFSKADILKKFQELGVEVGSSN